VDLFIPFLLIYAMIMLFIVIIIIYHDPKTIWKQVYQELKT
jgi:hypothetical protein